MWARKGRQPEVPAPGKNEKRVVYGGVDYATGKVTYTVAATKSGTHFLAFLVVLVAAYAGRKIRLVCDNGRFHTTKAVEAWLEANRERIEVYWLPPYCPSLNLIERLWGHLKRTALAKDLERNNCSIFSPLHIMTRCTTIRNCNGSSPRSCPTSMSGSGDSSPPPKPARSAMAESAA